MDNKIEAAVEKIALHYHLHAGTGFAYETVCSLIDLALRGSDSGVKGFRDQCHFLASTGSVCWGISHSDDIASEMEKVAV